MARGSVHYKSSSFAKWLTCILVSSSSFAPALSYAGSKEIAQRLFDRLTGHPIAVTNPLLAQMTAKIDAGDYLGAAELATTDDGFYNVTVKKWGATMSNRSEVALFQDPDRSRPPYFGSLNDFNATIIGVVRDNLDAKLLLTGDFIYKADTSIDKPGAKQPPFITSADARTSIQSDHTLNWTNDHYTFIEQQNVNLRQHLVQTKQLVTTSMYWGYDTNTPPPLVPNPDPAGLLSTRAFTYAHMLNGTNRRWVEFAFREFTCRPITQWADAHVLDTYVRRDVERAPAGDVMLFKNRCIACHGALDGMAGATAHYTWYSPVSGTWVQGGFLVRANGPLIYEADSNGVFNKHNKNAQNYPSGHVVMDDSWINQATQNQNVSFGWKGAVSGNGMNSFGQMIANSDAFPQCMAKRVFTEMCRRAPTESEAAIVKSLGDQFVSDKYNLRILFERAAILPNCLPQQ
jgi:hypothetical protein